MLRAFGRLPRGVALVRVQIPGGKLIALSDRLSFDEARVAQAMAWQKVRDGARAAVLGELEVADCLREIA